MSDNQPERSPSDTYRTADEIIRSILNDNASASSDISPSGELYRAIERFHANAHRRPVLVSSARRELVRSHLNRWASASASASTSASASATVSRTPSRNSMSSESNPNPNTNNRRRPSRDPRTTATSSTPSLPPLRSLNTSRRSSTMSTSGSSNAEGRPNRPRYAEQSPEPAADPLLNARWVDDLTSGPSYRYGEPFAERQARQARRVRESRQLRQAGQAGQAEDDDARLLSNWEFMSPNMLSHSELSFPSPPLQSHESTEESHRIKRRKLDSDRLSSGFRGFCYGKFGQVEPGPLKMEITSCDGGIYPDDGQRYVAENILKSDESVYCTKGPRCNIVLSHQGATVFTLKELVIKAPKTNYTSPVQEGMVFISMNYDALLDRTAKYQIQYISSSRSPRRPERATQSLAPIMSIRHNEDGSTMTRAQVRARRLYNIGMDDEESDFRVAQIPSEFTVSPPPFNVTTECSNDEADQGTARLGWRLPNRIGSLPFESDDSDDGAANLDVEELASRLSMGRRRNREESAEATQTMSQETSQAAGGDLMAPHARFYIESEKSKCTITFDPPVSGRYILLKMWSPHRKTTANIDIEAVIANGFAGPRYFPAVELR